MTKHKLFALVAIPALLAGMVGLLTLAGDEPTLEALLAEQEIEKAKLANFDDLDFRVFTGQKWADFHKSHAEDIKVHWPDGHTTEGLERHIEDLKAMFDYAPDTRINEHPVKIAQGDRLHGGDLLGADADRRRQDDPADREELPNPHGHDRSLDRGRRDGRGIPVLGQPVVHEADRSCRVTGECSLADPVFPYTATVS